MNKYQVFSVDENTLLLWEDRGEWSDLFKLTERVQVQK